MGSYEQNAQLKIQPKTFFLRVQIAPFCVSQDERTWVNKCRSKMKASKGLKQHTWFGFSMRKFDDELHQLDANAIELEIEKSA
jgi:hypothetical protein